MGKRKSKKWFSDSNDDEEVHHIEWPWDEDDDEIDENDESYGAEDYTSSRPWGIDNDG